MRYESLGFGAQRLEGLQPALDGSGAALCAKMSETVPTPDITDEGETG